MKVFRLLAAALAGLAPALVAFPAAAAASPEATDRIIVKWRADAGEMPDEAAETRGLAYRQSRRLKFDHPIGGRMSLVRLEREQDGAELEQTLATLRADPRVQFAAPDRRVRAHAYVPNDPLFANQWYLKSAQVAAIRADTAWDITRGGASPAASTVVIAVIDTGVRFDHPDLRTAAAGGKLLPGYDFVHGDSDGSFSTANDGDGWDADPSDPGDYLTAADLNNNLYKNHGCGSGGSDDIPAESSWHGTRVSGMIAADSDNNVGITGTGFHVRILPVRALGKCGGYDSDVLSGMYWAAGMTIPQAIAQTVPPVNNTPAQIINMSLGGVGPCEPTYVEAVREITARGVLIVVSAGNEGTAVDSPANCAGALAVAGVRHIGTKVGYSNVGPEVAIAAPAGNCVTVGPGDPCQFSLDTTTNAGTTTPTTSTYTNQFNSNIGTSFSAPLVAGIAGLMKAVNPRLTPSQITMRIKATARAFPTSSTTTPAPPACVLPTITPDQGFECICNTTVCGAGLLDAGAAVTDALRPTAVATQVGATGPGRTVSLDGSASGASINRVLVSYAWTQLASTGEPANPVINMSGQPVANVESPTSGSYTFQLRVTDNTGATDTAQLIVQASGGSSSTNPPANPTNDPAKGGGSFSTDLLLLLAALTIAGVRRRRTQSLA